jgi:hypothetical protein
MDSKYADARIVGWYHSHPDFGIFLSERDCFIHEHFFSGPGQVAYVIDPVRDLEGVFAWRGGKPTPLPHYWIGNDIRTVDASQRNVAIEEAERSPAANTNTPLYLERKPWDLSTLGIATALLGLLAVFSLGYLYGGWRSRWEEEMIIEGAVAHFANTKMIREGLETELAAVRSRMRVLSDELAKLPEPTAKLSDEERKAAAARRALIQDNLKLCETALASVETYYGLSDIERTMLARIAALKQAELRRSVQASENPSSRRQPDKPATKSDPSKSTSAPLPSKGNSPADAADSPAADQPPRAPQ